MLFNKKIEPRCVYCSRYFAVDEDHGICDRRGPVYAGGACRKFKYDPLKRVPPKGLLEEELPVFEDETDEKGTKSL
ncbi:MAG: hypothetical protein E7428_01705 [Ruminococcaceae bacterium]|nr:hypothetical protein [Oscillospiraceae bacterium]